jgi:hypothetical protein
MKILGCDLLSRILNTHEAAAGRELHPLKSSAFHGALFRQLSRSRDGGHNAGIVVKWAAIPEIIA